MLNLRNNGALCALHFGDLHITGAEEPNYRDYNAIVDEANRDLRPGRKWSLRGTRLSLRRRKIGLGHISHQRYFVAGHDAR